MPTSVRMSILFVCALYYIYIFFKLIIFTYFGETNIHAVVQLIKVSVFERCYYGFTQHDVTLLKEIFVKLFNACKILSEVV